MNLPIAQHRKLKSDTENPKKGNFFDGFRGLTFRRAHNNKEELERIANNRKAIN